MLSSENEDRQMSSDHADSMIEFYDPHFHIWDVGETGPHDKSVLFKPNGKELYDLKAYRNDLERCGLRWIGGTFIEAMSVCYVDRDGKTYVEHCMNEARWVNHALSGDGTFAIVPSVPLENSELREGALIEIQKMERVRGIRQILNHEPSWPRNKRLGNLLSNKKWIEGFRCLEKLNLSFDMQLNPSQFAAAWSLARDHPRVTVIINHLGTPTLDDLKDKKRSDIYWSGLKRFAELTHVFIKISMLCYICPRWDENDLVRDTVRRVIDLFGPDRCFFASNYPVDVKDGWPAERLFPAFRKLASLYSLETQRKLFSLNAMRAYRVRHAS